MRARKPWRRLRTILLGWKVRFTARHSINKRSEQKRAMAYKRDRRRSQLRSRIPAVRQGDFVERAATRRFLRGRSAVIPALETPIFSIGGSRLGAVG